jgi:hypothetical protein
MAVAPKKAKQRGLQMVSGKWTLQDVHLAHGESITWTAPEGKTIHVTFMNGYLFEKDGNKEEWTEFKIGPENPAETRTLANHVDAGVYRYAAYVEEDKVFAEGSSPPKIIVP